MTKARVAIIGGGPAGLMAAEQLVQAGHAVDLFDAMPSVGRKFLLAGVGGMNITHSEEADLFLSRYGQSQDHLAPMLASLGGPELRQWLLGLGIDTFVGSSGRVFPVDMKAAPLLRAWLARMKSQGLSLYVRHRWLGWGPEAELLFQSPTGELKRHYLVCLYALGGGSWAKLGSNGAWLAPFQRQGLSCLPLKPANCGFDANWSPHLSQKFAGSPLKGIAAAACAGADKLAGECVLTSTGLEGSLVYALSSALRTQLEDQGHAQLFVDLLPHYSLEQVQQKLAFARGKASLAKHLKNRLGLTGVKAALLHEIIQPEHKQSPLALAALIKNLPLPLVATRPLDEAISSAGGLAWSELDEQLMLKQKPGHFCAGEMLDWEAPTGGYLLTACFATGHWAGQAMCRYLAKQNV